MMENFPPEDHSRYDPLIERFARIKDKYGAEYPIIFYEPNIESQEKKTLRDLIQRNNCIHQFSKLDDANKFAQSLGISFILIASSDCSEEELSEGFQNLTETFKRQMFDFEEEALSKSLFKENGPKLLKAYVFWTLLDFMNATVNQNEEEEVMIMCDVKDMAQHLQQEFIIIWYDPDINTEKKIKLEEKLEINVEEKNIYTDFAELYTRLKNYAGTPYHLILSRREQAEKILKEMEDFRDLLGLYIYCNNHQEIEKLKNEKVEIKPTFEELLPKIKEGLRERSKVTNTFPVFATNFDAWDKSSTYSNHYFLKVLINFANRKQARDDFIKLARKIYQDSPQLLKRFEIEYDQYDNEKILFWYSRDSPIYRLINNCLRISSSDSILFCRFVLKDLERAIRERHQQYHRDFNGVVYRAAYISENEFEKLKRNIGKEIEMYGFFSTSVSSRAASRFFSKDTESKIWITIIVPPLLEEDEQGFADISSFSDFPTEKEILFNVRSIFRILEAGMRKTGSQGAEYRYVDLLYAPQLLRREMTKNKSSLKVELKLPLDIKCEMCSSKNKLLGFEENKTTHVNCFDCLIKNSLPKDTPLVALDKEDTLKENRNLAKVFRGKLLKFKDKVSFQISGYKCKDCGKTEKNKYYKWISLEGDQSESNQCAECFEKKREIRSNILISEESPYRIWLEPEKEWETIDSEYRGEFSEKVRLEAQDDVYFEVQRFDLCIAFEKAALIKLVRRRRREMEKMKAYEKLGRSFQRLGQAQEALKYYHKCLFIVKTVYGETHEDVATVYNNLAAVYRDLEEHQKVLEYFAKALEITKVVFGEIHERAASSYNNISSVYQSLGEYQQAGDYCTKALNIRKAISGENHPETAALYNNLAVIYEEFGEEQRALELSKKALGIWKSIFGEKHPDTATAYNTLAAIYEGLGENEKALEHYKTALDIKKSIYGEKHPATALSFNNLASRYESLGEYQKALEFYQMAHGIWKACYGEKHLGVAVSYGNLASVYESLGEFQKATEYFKKALNIRKMLSQESHPDNATTLIGLGRLCKNSESYQEALDYYNKALDIWKVSHKENHPSTADLYHGLGSIHKSLGDYPKAKEYFTKALDIRKAIYGENHAETAHSLTDLAELCLDSGEPSHALEYARKSLDIRKTLYGEKNADVAVSYNDLASVFQSMGEYQRAKEFFTKALEIRKALFGENHQCTAVSYSNLAVVCVNLGSYKLALEYCKKSLDIRKAIYGENHSETALSYNNLASIYDVLKDYQKALELHQKALNIRKLVHEENHPDIANSYNDIGGTYESLGEYEKAIEHHEKALDIMKVIYDENHPDLAFLYNNLASAYEDLGRNEEALKYYKKASDIWITNYGKDHPDTATSFNNIAIVYLNLRDLDRAFKYCKEALGIRKAIFGEMHPDTVLSYKNLASICGSRGELQQAKKYQLKAQSIERALEEENPTVGY